METIAVIRNTENKLTKHSRPKFAKVVSNGLQVGSLQLVKIAVFVKGEKVRLIHDMRRNGTNAKVQLEERLVLPRHKDIVEGVMKLMAIKTYEEGIDFLTLDFRDAFEQLHVVDTERPFLSRWPKTDWPKTDWPKSVMTVWRWWKGPVGGVGRTSGGPVQGTCVVRSSGSSRSG